ncbi:MAG: 50S ribosomal protein L4 [Phycisphaerales bacterium]|nr:MAG: 50S ribosomal protein L4 [Phycisphaerales bacterium]
MEVPVLNIKGERVGSMQIDETTLGGEVIPALIKQAYVRYHANKRQGSARTRNRGNVEGSTRKLYRQKGTGNSRVGPARVPGRKGGGVAFAKTKTREDYRLDMPVKMRRKANRNALLAKLIDNEVRVIDDLSFESPRTKDMIALLAACKIDRTCLMALNAENDNARLGARNVPGVSTVPVEQLTCFEMLNHRYMIIAKSDLESWLEGASSKIGKDAKRLAGRKEAA